jgi:hypothetical protein
MSQTTEKRSRFSHFGGWVAELVLVFLSVYAAFWLNNYQQHRQDAERRDRILASIEQTLRVGIESGKINRANEERGAAEFRRALDAGEMPPLRPFVFITDYSPGDFATMLQSGGIQLLDLQTLTALRNDESVIRWGLSRMARYQKLSDELIVPYLDQDISFFYDPARSGHKEIAKTVRDISRSATSNCEIRSRPGTNPHRAAQTNSSRTPTPSLI